MKKKQVLLIVLALMILAGLFLCFSRGVLLGIKYVYYHGYLYKATGEKVASWGYEPTIGSIKTNNGIFVPDQDLEAANIPVNTVVYSRHFSDCENPECLYIADENNEMEVFRDVKGKLTPPYGYPSGTIQSQYLLYKETLYKNTTEMMQDGAGLTEVGTVQKTDNTQLPDEEMEASRLFPGQKVFVRTDDSERRVYVQHPGSEEYEIYVPDVQQ